MFSPLLHRLPPHGFSDALFVFRILHEILPSFLTPIALFCCSPPIAVLKQSCADICPKGSTCNPDGTIAVPADQFVVLGDNFTVVGNLNMSQGANLALSPGASVNVWGNLTSTSATLNLAELASFSVNGKWHSIFSEDVDNYI